MRHSRTFLAAAAAFALIASRALLARGGGVVPVLTPPTRGHRPRGRRGEVRVQSLCNGARGGTRRATVVPPHGRRGGAAVIVGWARGGVPALLRDGGNPRIKVGRPATSTRARIKKLQVPEGWSRAMGDVHPDGNLHSSTTRERGSRRGRRPRARRCAPPRRASTIAQGLPRGLRLLLGPSPRAKEGSAMASDRLLHMGASIVLYHDDPVPRAGSVRGRGHAGA